MLCIKNSEPVDDTCQMSHVKVKKKRFRIALRINCSETNNLNIHCIHVKKKGKDEKKNIYKMGATVIASDTHPLTELGCKGLIANIYKFNIIHYETILCFKLLLKYKFYCYQERVLQNFTIILFTT